MAVPKKKIARSAGRARRTAWVKRTAARLLGEAHLVADKVSGALRLSHQSGKTTEAVAAKANTTRVQA